MMFRKAVHGSVLVVACFAHAACLFDPEACTMEARVGLRVTVRNAETGAPAGPGATVTATDGAYRETLLAFPDSLTFLGATERPGTYDVQVIQVGFQSWSRQGVEVRDGGCHVETTDLDVRLEPLAGSSIREEPPHSHGPRRSPG